MLRGEKFKNISVDSTPSHTHDANLPLAEAWWVWMCCSLPETMHADCKVRIYLTLPSVVLPTKDKIVLHSEVIIYAIPDGLLDRHAA
jgi:hypothetical protein